MKKIFQIEVIEEVNPEAVARRDLKTADDICKALIEYGYYKREIKVKELNITLHEDNLSRALSKIDTLRECNKNCLRISVENTIDLLEKILLSMKE